MRSTTSSRGRRRGGNRSVGRILNIRSRSALTIPSAASKRESSLCGKTHVPDATVRAGCMEAVTHRARTAAVPAKQRSIEVCCSFRRHARPAAAPDGTLRHVRFAEAKAGLRRMNRSTSIFRRASAPDRESGFREKVRPDDSEDLAAICTSSRTSEVIRFFHELATTFIASSPSRLRKRRSEARSRFPRSMVRQSSGFRRAPRTRKRFGFGRRGHRR